MQANSGGVGPALLEVIPIFYPHNNIGHIGCQRGSCILVEKERFELSIVYFIKEYHPNNFNAGACSRSLFQLNTISIRGNWRGAHSPQPSNHEVLLSYNTPLNGLAGPRSFIMLGGLVSSTSASSELYNLYRATTLERSRMRSIQPPHSTLFCFRLRDLLSTNVWSIVHLSRRTDIICHSFRR